MTSRTHLSREADVMHRFWDGGARKHPYFCVASGPQYLGADIDLDAYFQSGEQAVLRLIGLANWHPGPSSRLIEIGCGTGRETKTLAARFGFVDAIDISETMITKAQRDLGDIGNVRLHVSNGIDLSDFAPDTFDYAFSELVFRHIPDKSIIKNYLSETARVLVPGGSFAYQYNGRRRFAMRRFVSGAKYSLRALVAAGRRRLRGKPVDPGYTVSAAWRGCKISAQEIGEACTNCGLLIDQVLGQGSDEMWVIGHKPAEQKEA
jgi:SAM-dependent methyltransferase